MKSYNKLVILLIAFFCAEAFNTIAQPEQIRIIFGLEKPPFYVEDKATKDQNSSIWPPKKPNDITYRFFRIKQPDYIDFASQLFADHWEYWNKYKEKVGDSNVNREEYLAYIKKQAPHHAGLLDDLAPVLYFDFIGLSGKEYILKTIQIETLGFFEYRGGGFFDKTAWYDIELCHEIGTKSYDVNKKLRFNGSGRAQIRFWSDNYYPLQGLTPMGCYTINITFVFLVNGEEIKASTGVFKIDV